MSKRPQKTQTDPEVFGLKLFASKKIIKNSAESYFFVDAYRRWIALLNATFENACFSHLFYNAFNFQKVRK